MEISTVQALQRNALAYLAVILLANSSDVEANPGPAVDGGVSNNSILYPCGCCGNEVTWDDRAICCDTCDTWYHTQYENVRDVIYETLMNSSISWDCYRCGSPNFSSALFDSSLLDLSNSFEPLSQLSDRDQSAASSPGPPNHTSSPVKPKVTSRSASKPLRVLNINCRSLKNTKEHFWNAVDGVKPDVILGTESWLNTEVKDNEVFPPGFNIYRKDRPLSTGGRVFLAVNSEFISSSVPELDSDCEIVWAKLEVSGQKATYLASYYRPPNNDINSLENLQSSLDKLGSRKNSNIIMAGDMNLPGWDWANGCLKEGASNISLHNLFAETLADYNLTQIVEEPTRGENILDLICTNNPSRVNRVHTIPGIADHDGVFAELDVRPIRPKQKRRSIPLYRKADWENLQLHQEKLHSRVVAACESSSASDLWCMFRDGVQEGIRQFIPHKIAKTRDNLPWLTQDIKKLMRKRDKCYAKLKKAKQDKTKLKSTLKSLKHQIQREVRSAYWSYVEGIIEPLDEEQPYQGMKRFWTFMKHARSDGSGIVPLRRNGLLVSDSKGKAEILNAQFESVFTQDGDIPDNLLPSSSQYPTAPEVNITENGVRKLLLKLNIHKACGPDQIVPRVLKELASTIAPILTIIFRVSIDTGVVPEDWRTADIAPIFKKGQKYVAANYRPVSLTCIASKLIEHIVVSNIMGHASTHSILYDYQHGFRSCETQLIQFVTDINNNLHKGLQTDLLVMDFSKAVDKVSHARLVKKLEYYGVRGKTNNWIENFLGNRKQSVVVEGEKSAYVPVLSGVPQGSVLGPCLFLFYINDIQDGLHSTVQLFADDTILYCIVLYVYLLQHLVAKSHMVQKYTEFLFQKNNKNYTNKYEA